MIRFCSEADLRRTGHVARLYAIRNASLVESVAKRSTSFAEAMMSEPTLSTTDSAQAVLSSDGRELVVRVTFGIALRALGASPAFVEVSCVFELNYERVVAEPVATDEDVQVFAKINGLYNAWPYVRELVSSCFGRLGYAPYTLEPLIIAPEPQPIPASVGTAR